MPKTISIGQQDFEAIIKGNAFYVDKTLFIKEWWENLNIWKDEKYRRLQGTIPVISLSFANTRRIHMRKPKYASARRLRIYISKMHF